MYKVYNACMLALILALSPVKVTADTKTPGKNYLEILDVKFEPIRQGKNIVQIQVKNISEEDQIFMLGIYTRSPDYGRSGVGWGTSFFETIIKDYKTKWTRFAFKIQGPVTNRTYIRLTFDNPAPALNFDKNKRWENWFKKETYNSSDLEHRKTDINQSKPASKAQTEAIIQIFKKIQNYIKDKNYEQAWQLFTKDHQQAEFQRDGFERFKKIMEPSRPIDSAFWWEKDDFINLQPETVIEQNGIFTLVAKHEQQRWKIDFVQKNGRWKIDWIAGYIPRILQWQNWEEHVLPKMRKHSTEHFDIYYFKDSTAAKEPDELAEQKEKGYRQISNFLQTNPDLRIRLVLFEDKQTKHYQTGHQGMGWAYGNTIVEVYNEKERLDPYHETVHILMGPFGEPPALFNEGFAVYMSERLGAHALEDLSGGQATIYQRIRELKSKGQWIELEELLTYTEIGSMESRPYLAYPEAASFVKFLIDKYGRDKFLRTYETLKNSNNKKVHQQNVKKLADIYGQPLHKLEEQWQETILSANRTKL